jgi:hypothetical protein
MALIDRMSALNARLTAIPIRFGVPQHRDVLVRYKVLDDDYLTATVNDVLLEPKPIVQNVPQKLVGYSVGGQTGGGIDVRADDFMLSNIPRSYSTDDFVKNVQFLVIDPEIGDDGNPALDVRGNPVGIICKVLHVSDRELLTWSLIVRKLVDGHDVTRVEVTF